MKKTNKILALSAITAMSVAMAACDDSSGSSSPIDTCKASCKNATTAISCDANGNEVEQDCAKENKVCDASFKCVAKGEAQTCVEMCNGSHELVTCDSNGKPHTENCARKGMECKDNQCVQPAVVYKIGDPCTCTGASCNKTLTGKEMVAGLSALVGGFNIDFNLIKDDDTITFPDFFSKDIQGCQGIVAPEGMTIGCFRDSNITVTSQDGTKGYEGSGLKAFVDSLEKNEQFGDKLKPYASKLHKILTNGVAFSSTNGYCLAATIDIKAKGLVAVALANDVLSALVSLVNTGDHSKAKLGTVVCPEGGVKFDYEIAKTVNKGLYGLDLNVGFDMCLKSCETDADCRQNEGYTCVDIPNGVPAENETQQVQKACFDKDNLDYFKNLTNQFNGTTEETPKT